MLNVSHLYCIKDATERSVKMTTDFLDVALKEENLQNMMQVVEWHRGVNPDIRMWKRSNSDSDR